MKNAREKFERWVVASVLLHAGVVLSVFVVPSLFAAHTATWGSKTGGNGGVNVKIVSNISGIPLPPPPVTVEGAVSSENKSLYKNEPEPKVKAPEKSDPDTVKLESKTAPKKPEPAKPAPPVKTADATPPTPQPSNAVAYGSRGGNPALQYGQTAPSTGPTGADFGGDGTFGEKFGDYVERMKNAITEAWRGINLSQQRSPRVYVLFTIDKNGKVSNAMLEHPTTNPSAMELAALRAVRTATLPALPPDYRGPPVAVRFYFDYAQ